MKAISAITNYNYGLHRVEDVFVVLGIKVPLNFLENLRKKDKQTVLQSMKKSSSEKGKKKRKSLTSARKGFIDKLRRRKRGIIFKEGLLNLKTS